MEDLWTPTQTTTRPVKPGQRKDEGGTWFDDELNTQADHDSKLQSDILRLIDHINKRPDHRVYVGSTDERAKMREVFNMWKRAGLIGYNPTIQIDYGVADGAIRVDV